MFMIVSVFSGMFFFVMFWGRGGYGFILCMLKVDWLLGKVVNFCCWIGRVLIFRSVSF